MGRVRTNPLMYFQPTSWTVLSAAQQQLEQYQESGVNWRVSQRCCDHLATLSAGGCLCNPQPCKVPHTAAAFAALKRAGRPP